MTTALQWTTHRPTWWSARTDDASAEITRNDRGAFEVRVWNYEDGRRSVCRDVQSLGRAQELAVELMACRGAKAK